jgi:hypothetical protein
LGRWKVAADVPEAVDVREYAGAFDAGARRIQCLTPTPVFFNSVIVHSPAVRSRYLRFALRSVTDEARVECRARLDRRGIKWMVHGIVVRFPAAEVPLVPNERPRNFAASD